MSDTKDEYYDLKRAIAARVDGISSKENFDHATAVLQCIATLAAERDALLERIRQLEGGYRFVAIHWDDQSRLPYDRDAGSAMATEAIALEAFRDMEAASEGEG